jgi:hypothetical protein
MPTAHEGACQFGLSEPDAGRPGRSSFDLGAKRLALASQGIVRGLCTFFVLLRRFIFGDNDIGLILASGGKSSPVHGTCYRSPGYTETVGDRQDAFASGVGVSNFIDGKVDDSGILVKGGNFKPALGLPPHKSRVGDPNLDRYLGAGHALRTKASNVVSVNTRMFSGHVYNLQTISGWYVTNGIVTHNCRCSMVYIYNIRALPDDMLTAKGRERVGR